MISAGVNNYHGSSIENSAKRIFLMDMLIN